MIFNLTKKILYRFALLALTAILFFSCQKQLSFENDGIVVNPPDLSTKISSTVSGFVTDENNAAVMGASVQFGASTITTDKYGYFEAKNVQVVKNAAVVAVIKPGYFKGIKTYIAAEGKSAFFRIKLIPKTIAGNINAASGGTVTLSNGLSVKLPAGGIVNAATNASYTGTVNVAAYWIGPTAIDLSTIMPGDLRGINTDGVLKLLQTFGMAAVELTGSSGELLQIVNGQKATLTFPIPSSLTVTAPTTIPLWYFDETNGLWKQEGSATKNGNTYVGDVGHFSFWNCDVPANYVQFNCTLKNSAGNPLPYTLVKITEVGTNNAGWGYTDSSGYVGGAVPNNSNLLLEVFATYGCSNAIYSQTFTTTNVNLSLGTITVSAMGSIATISGTVTNCTNTAVTNGNIIILEGNSFTRYALSNTGTYNFTRPFCTLSQTIILIGEDVANAQQSINVAQVVNAGANTVANIQACGTITQQFINYTINSTPYSFTVPADTFAYFNNNQSSIYINGGKPFPTPGSVTVYFSNTAIALGSNQLLQNFWPNPIADSLQVITPVLVNITEYGAIGEFVSGNFSGILAGKPPLNTPYNVTCNFRIRRSN